MMKNTVKSVTVFESTGQCKYKPFPPYCYGVLTPDLFVAIRLR